ncbi:MAG: leucine-rich repeat protein [Clostridia bacterium]|nr:leucine-rich repeat protein [Clostridia bacterium]
MSIQRLLIVVIVICCCFSATSTAKAGSDYYLNDEFSFRAQAFKNWNGEKISCFVQEKEDGWLEASFWWNDPDVNMLVSEYAVSENSELYAVVDGVLYSKDMGTLLLYPPMKDSSFFMVPSTVHKISDVAFMGSYNLKILIIPNSVNQFGDNYGSDLFYESCIEVIYFPDSIKTDIDIDAFAYMPCVQRIYIPNNSEIAQRFVEADESGYLTFVSSGIVCFYDH